MKYLLDTNICVFLFRGQYGVAEKISALGMENCAISEITKAELLVGVEMARLKGREYALDALDAFFSNIEVVPVGECLPLFAKEKARLYKAGTPLEDFDLMIGCSALSRCYKLISDNVKHMSRISGLYVENWIQH